MVLCWSRDGHKTRDHFEINQLLPQLLHCLVKHFRCGGYSVREKKQTPSNDIMKMQITPKHGQEYMLGQNYQSKIKCEKAIQGFIMTITKKLSRANMFDCEVQ